MRVGVNLIILLLIYFLKMDSEIPTDGLSPPFTVADMMSTTEGPLCYVYE
jgi:hypothetical protein